MEISILPNDGIRLKSKQAQLLINPSGNLQGSNAALYLSSDHPAADDESIVLVDGPGDYEVGGVKFSGIRSGKDVVYSLILDGVNVMVGKIAPLEKVQHKVKEHDVLLVTNDDSAVTDAAFITGLATSYLVAVGKQGKALIDSFGKETPEVTGKIVMTKDKLPAELQTVLLG